MATTQIKNGFHGGTDDQLLVNPDGSINVNTTGGGGSNVVAITDTPGGTTYVDIENIGGKNALDVNVKAGSVTGSITPQGLSNGRNTCMSVSTTALALPASPLANRNAMAIHNKSTTQTLYIGFDASVTAGDSIGNTAGWEVPPGGELHFDLQNTATIYGIFPTGADLVKLMELSST